MNENPRADASYICCPMCDMDFETPKGKCPGYQNCQEITRYLRGKNTEDSEWITIAEYAKRHGIPRNTVAYWCKAGKLKGVVKQPDPKCRFAKYIYLIPKDAEKQEQTPEHIARKHGMLTASEYARRMGYCRKTVLYWCLEGLIPGAVKAEQGGSRQFWMIPEDAKLARPYMAQKVRKKKAPEEPAMEKPKPKRQLTEREISLHIRRHCGTRTYQQLAEDLGISVEDVRRRYERLHRMYGV